MQIILMTYPGERPMRPAFGSRLRDFVFRSADDSTAAELALEVRNSLLRWEPRVDVHRRPRGARSARRRIACRSRSSTRSSGRTTSATWCSPSTRSPTTEVSTDGDRRPQPRRSAVPGPRRRRQADGDGALPGVDRPQRVRPGRHADRDVRVHDRPAPVPAQPRPRPLVRQVPRADRDPAVPGDGGAHPADVLAVGAGDLDARDPTRHAGGDRGDRAPRSRSCSARSTIWRSCRRELAVVATRRASAASVVFRTDELRVGAAVPAFADVPAPGDVLLVGLDTAAPGNAVALRFDCEIDGVGVDPHDPPLQWEAWNGTEWEACDVEHDETGGLNRRGDIVLHLPLTHAASMLEEKRAGWVRARVTRRRRRSAAVPLVAADPRPRRDDGRRQRPGRARRDDRDRDRRRGHRPARRPLPSSRAVRSSRSTTPSIEVSSPTGWEQWEIVDVVRRSRSRRPGRGPRRGSRRDRVRPDRAARGRHAPRLRGVPAGQGRDPHPEPRHRRWR